MTESFDGATNIDRIAELPLAEKRSILADLLKQGTNGFKTYPLSYAQQRLWFLAQLESDSSFYTISSATAFRGQIRLDILERAINEIVRRHEILRTTYQTIDGTPFQVVSPSINSKLPLIDLRDLSASEAEKETERLCAQES